MFKKAVCFELDKIKKSDIFYSIFFDVIFVLILMFTLVNDKKLVNTNKICRAGATKEALLLIDKFELSCDIQLSLDKESEIQQGKFDFVIDFDNNTLSIYYNSFFNDSSRYVEQTKNEIEMKLAEKYDEILESQSIEKLYVYKINNISMPEQLTPRNYAIISRLIILFTYCLIRVFSRLYGITISKERKYKTLMIISNTKLSHKDIVLSKILATSIVGLILSGLLFVVTYLIGLKEILILNYFLINYIISFLILLILINVLIMSISFCAKKPTIYINTITIFMWVLYFVITLNNDIISHYLSLAPIISAFTIIINLFSNNVNSFYIIYSYGTSLIIIMLLLINTIKKLSNEALYNELD